MNTARSTHVVAHVAVSIDGATGGFPVDLGAYYGLASTWNEDVTLTGADTLLAPESGLDTGAPGPGPNPDGPLLAVVDSRCRLTAWDALRATGYWRDVVALRSLDTAPGTEPAGLRTIRAGEGRVDLRAVLDVLAAEGARTVRVDSGGSLVGALAAKGLLDEISLVVHPHLVGDACPRRWWGSATSGLTDLSLTAAETLPGGLVWMRYLVARAG